MAMNVVKRVRLSDEQAELLKRLARSKNETESSILREGLRLVGRMVKREENIHQLLDLCDIGEDSYVKWEGKL
jgi:predicted transcriptional regulator